MSLLDKLQSRSQVIQGFYPMADQFPITPVSQSAPAPKPFQVASVFHNEKSLENKMQQRIELAKTEDGTPFQYVEIKRICNLPIVQPLSPEEKDYYDRVNIIADAYNDGFRLFNAQADAVSSYERFGGLLAPVEVGGGKTAISLMVANKAFQKGIRKMVLFVPSPILCQLVQTDIKWARRRVPITFPIHVMGGRTMHARRQLAKSGREGLYIIPYSLLSVKDTSENLYNIKPGIIIADEVHNIAKKTAARTKRITEYVEDYKPELAVMSGTITSKSIKDYYHLARWALGQNNPLPNAATLAEEWASVIDAQATNYSDTVPLETKAGPLLPLVEWARKHFPDKVSEMPFNILGFRSAYKLRFNSAPGVVRCPPTSIGTSIIVHNEPATIDETNPDWLRLKELIRKVEEEWLTPNDDEIEYAIHTWKWLYELSAGFYNELTWPTSEMYANRKSISIPEAEDIIERAKDHHVAQQAYASMLRKWLSDHGKQGMDTPMLVGNEMSRNGAKHVGHDLYETWMAWKNADFEGRPDRDEKAIRVYDYKIQAALRWAQELKKGKGALIWVAHQEMGKWMYEALLNSGFNTLYCPAGAAANQAILDEANRNKIVVASLWAHGEGKNLQAFEHNYILQWPRPAYKAEQLLGRTHRYGQKADELVFVQNNTLASDDLNFAACLNDALYIHQTTGTRQKLIYASYDPLPKLFPSSVLYERGLETKRLNSKQEKELMERFGQE